MPQRPKKPYSDFPLNYQPSIRYWCKFVGGRKRRFGPRDCDWQTALAEYQAWQSFQDGQPTTSGVTVKELLNDYLNAKSREVKAGEFSERTLKDYAGIGLKVVEFFGANRSVESIAPSDFAEFKAALSDGVSVITTGNRVRVARIIFRHAENAELIPGRVRFGKMFGEPSSKRKKLHAAEQRRQHGLKMFDPADIRQLLYAAKPAWRAKILLGLNCGYGNTDLSDLRIKQIRSGDRDVIRYPRIKTGENRVSIMWPETLQAVRDAIKSRPAAHSSDLDDRVFLTKSGRAWVRPDGNNEITKQFAKLLNRCHLKRHGVNFYSLRHTFATVADEVGDIPALKLMLGHADGDMVSQYRERIERSRLDRIANHIMLWLGRPDTVRRMAAF